MSVNPIKRMSDAELVESGVPFCDHVACLKTAPRDMEHACGGVVGGGAYGCGLFFCMRHLGATLLPKGIATFCCPDCSAKAKAAA